MKLPAKKALITGAPFGAPIILDVFTPPGSEAKLAKAHAQGDPQ
jgi:hypothetical protein